MEQVAPTIEQVITNISFTILKLSPFLIGFSIGFTQWIKKFTKNDKIIAGFSMPIGYAVGTLFMVVLGNKVFAPMTILIGVFSGLGSPAIYSVGKTFTPKSETPTQ